MKKIDVWFLWSSFSIENKQKEGYIDEFLSKAKDEYKLNVEIKDIQKFILSSSSKNELYYDGKLVKELPKYAVVRRYEIYLCRQLELMGVKVFNSVNSMVDARNKMKVHQILGSHKISMPKTVFTVFKNNCSNISYDNVVNIIGSSKFVVKWIYGSQGKHVYLVDNKEKFDELVTKYNGRILCQEFIEESFGMDIRAYVINGRFIGAAIRKSNGDDFRSNLAQGGEALEVQVNEKIIALAENAAKAIALDICGVDILIGKNQYYVCEVNALPGFKSIKKISGIDEKDILLGLIKDKTKEE